MQRPETEILVHIAAPARGVDDARYRTLAAAYFDFKPAHYTRISAGQAAQEEGETTLPNEREFVGMGIGQGSPSLTQEHGVMDSPILSFQSANNNFHSPRLPFIAPASEPHISETQSSWQAPPSEIQDSMPNGNIVYDDLWTPSRKLDFFTSSLESQQMPSSPLVRRKSQRLVPSSQPQSLAPSQLRRSPRRRRNFQETTRSPDSSPPKPSLSRPSVPQPSLPQSRTYHGSYPPGQPQRQSSNQRSILPQETLSVSLSKEPSRPELFDAAYRIIPQSPDVSFIRRSNPTQTSSGEVIEETVLYSSNPTQKSVPCILEPPALVRAESEPVAKRRRPANDLEPGQPLVRSTSDIGPRRQPPARLPPNKPLAYYAAKLSVSSPPPPTAQTVLEPSDVISPVLSKLATELDLPSRFIPASQTRELRPFERGYWLVETTTWPPDLKKSAWTFLTNYIENGVAGWGTSCSRAEDYSWIKLRCWGCVVGHMHLVLYVASRRQVKDTGMKWYGGDGEVVVVMGPR
ncbi:hypothetical protein QBC40DRAFT_264345 [Triangularia verruculosa]|uniref:Uncharacterized protein n=1 Tax=Triangularia verruculosa TaxID=2587418 RepID=A0AAN6XJ87_9PEZI|nr:hypothetical protein QBC40DRAFT_264345 [Triangularia verruculosa]